MSTVVDALRSLCFRFIGVVRHLRILPSYTQLLMLVCASRLLLLVEFPSLGMFIAVSASLELFAELAHLASCSLAVHANEQLSTALHYSADLLPTLLWEVWRVK